MLVRLEFSRRAVLLQLLLLLLVRLKEARPIQQQLARPGKTQLPQLLLMPPLLLCLAQS
jgi:hypothetical protein